VSSERCSHVNRGGRRSPPRIVFLPETIDAENFGELVRAAAADLAGGLLGRRSLQVATAWLTNDNLLMPHLLEQGAHGCFRGVGIAS
jgi:hypothetical protein